MRARERVGEERRRATSFLRSLPVHVRQLHGRDGTGLRSLTMTVQSILIVVALILAVLSGTTARVPLWISVLLICIALLVGTRIA